MEFDYTLLAKYITEELSAEEMAKVLAWRAASPDNNRLFREIVELRISWKYQNYRTPAAIDRAMETLNRRINRRQFMHRLQNVARYAAVLVLLISASYVGWKQFSPADEYAHISVSPGEEIKKITLEEGSVIWLREGSTLHIPHSFTAHSRTVKLEGEAFFKINKNKHPFHVETEALRIQVLGTSFNVRTVEESRMVETILVNGKVALLNKAGKQVMHLSPGEKVTYDARHRLYSTEKVDANILTAWHLNQVVLENKTLGEIIRYLSDLYHVPIYLEAIPQEKHTYKIILNQGETLENILEQLEYVAPIRYEKKGSEVFIYMNP